ncbi:MAG: GDP-mannose 4,6-dehydratase, partial [Proteobacteria bacterium]|nr:GDP-mannose 4,6-dehydratase [Pseudomonadota bacterium]
MKLLVTGGAGFIGSNFIRYILGKYSDYEIINLDNLTYAGNLENLINIESGIGKARYSFIKGDIADTQCVDGILRQGVNAVINFAAESHVDRSIDNARIFLETNVVGAQVLLDAALRH